MVAQWLLQQLVLTILIMLISLWLKKAPAHLNQKSPAQRFASASWVDSHVSAQPKSLGSLEHLSTIQSGLAAEFTRDCVIFKPA